MANYAFWIDWFRAESAKLRRKPSASPKSGTLYDADRIRRAVKSRAGATTVRNFDLVRSASPAQRMIDWIKTLPTDVAHAAAEHLNWDQAGEVILWLVDQPTTDAATAVKLFLRAEPAFYVEFKAEDPDYEYEEFAERIILTFAANWTAGRYTHGGVGYDPSEVSPYGSSDIFFINELNETLAKHHANGIYPLPPLPKLKGPFKGPKPKDFGCYLDTLQREDFFFIRFLFVGLGTWLMNDEFSDADFDEWIRKNDLSHE